MPPVRRIVAVLSLVLGLGGLAASPALACSPVFNPTIAALGPKQVVVVGTTGERVPGGRLFHVERWFNGGPPVTPIVIAFKEGEPIGDCSYPVAAGTRLVLAPYRAPDGALAADLATLQAPPDSADGRRYLAEATELFGPGVVPPGPEPLPADDGPDLAIVVGGVVLGVVTLFAAVVVLGRRPTRSA